MSHIQYLTQIYLESGAIQRLPSECIRLNIKKPLVVTDQGIKSAGILSKIEVVLQGMDFVVFDQTPSNPTQHAAEKGKELYEKNFCDGLIALGGGSSIDCAKVISILTTHQEPLKNYATIEGGSNKITAQVTPLIAVPTTSGTGSEVARGAILILDDQRKVGFHSWHILPKSAICDPDLTLNLPLYLTAATGMDAIAHCIETFLNVPFNPTADAIALDGLERAWQNIELATQNGQHQEARLQMMTASMHGAMAFQKGLGCIHSLSHSLGGLLPNLHHGTLNAVFLPAVLRFNAKAESVIEQKKMRTIATKIGVSDESIVPEAMLNLSKRLGLPTGLKDLGIEDHHFEKIIQGALKDHCHFTNPRIATFDDYKNILLESM
ncbi:iron-containing alcohol dehydrogenase [Polynucleobacter rarus]|uniref:iron-containing alcohol dehydrogenase n=1 Tax=Polynucleobacter rarus TaxID=556055 RepID=UPI000D3E4628|nr:iron-containing alcohol dehydrogenase [Polynucleobacter rarus]